MKALHVRALDQPARRLGPLQRRLDVHDRTAPLDVSSRNAGDSTLVPFAQHGGDANHGPDERRDFRLRAPAEHAVALVVGQRDDGVDAGHGPFGESLCEGSDGGVGRFVVHAVWYGQSGQELGPFRDLADRVDVEILPLRRK